MSSLPLAVWSAGDYQFALAASQVQSLQPYTAGLDSQNLLQIIPDLPVEPLLYCLCWELDSHPQRLAISSEPEHLQLPLEQLWPLPASLQYARRHPAIRALGWHRERPLILLDATRLGLNTTRAIA